MALFCRYFQKEFHFIMNILLWLGFQKRNIIILILNMFHLEEVFFLNQ